jgi:hypothetical protein
MTGPEPWSPPDEGGSLPPRLLALAAALAAPREQIESAFLAVGAGLGDAAILLDRIVGAFEALPRDLDGPQMSEAAGRLADFVRNTREITAAFSVEGRDIAALKDAVAAARHPIDGLKRAVKLMDILAVNARIVAAGLNGDADHFGVFTTDIANLAGGARKAITAFAEGHQQLATAVEGAAAQFLAFDAAHRNTLVALADSLDSGLADLAARRAASASRSAETARVSREVSARVAGAVMALQVGDATRQRVQHGEEALAAIAAWLDGAAVAGITLPVAARDGFATLALDLQAAQLGDILATFNHETAETETALVELASDAGAAIADCRRLYGGAGGTSSLAALGAEMRRAAALLRECDGERQRLGRLAVAVDDTVEVLVGHVEAVQEIEANMRLVGLNAAVKCAQLGPRGAALSVIATQLRELTRDIVAAARTATASLEQATTAARAFTTQSAGKVTTELGRLEAEAMQALALLEAVDGRLRAALAALERDGPTAAAQLEAASRGLDGHAAIAEALSDVHIRLAGLVPDTAAASDPAALAAAFAHLRRGYSMEAERRLHDRLIGEPPEPVSAPESAEVDDALFF